MLECKICKKTYSANSIRLGFCWYCIEMESIIDTGIDMDGKGLYGNDPCKTPMEKVRLIRERNL